MKKHIALFALIVLGVMVLTACGGSTVRGGKCLGSANDELKRAQKDGEVSEDDSRRGHEDVQKLTDKHTGAIDELCKNKEQELMEV